MGLLSDLAAWLVEEALVTAVGTDTFLDYKPDSPTNVVMLFEYDSLMPMVKGGEIGVRYVQVSVRNEQADTARSKCNALFDLFFRFQEEITTLTAGRIMLVFPKTSPLKIEENAFSTSYAFNVAITTKTD